MSMVFVAQMTAKGLVCMAARMGRGSGYLSCDGLIDRLPGVSRSCNHKDLTYRHQSGRSDWQLAINSLTCSGSRAGSKLDTESR
jgi:hypothetical protein